jgi:protein-tyrosine-phosphatase
VSVPVVVLCTGNAARSVMAGVSLAQRLPTLDVFTAGTHVIEGQPLSVRTRAGLTAIGMPTPVHRTRQARAEELEAAALVVCLAPEHVAWVRRAHPTAAARTGTLHRLVRYLPTVTGPLPERVAALGLAEVELEPWEEVVDPAGGDIPDFEACAREIADLVVLLAAELAEHAPVAATAEPEHLDLVVDELDGAAGAVTDHGAATDR